MRCRSWAVMLVIAMLVLLGLVQAATAAAVWTTTADGRRVDANIYDVKCPPAYPPGPPLAPFLNGGPNLFDPSAWLPGGTPEAPIRYKWGVFDPPAKVLLSTDSIEQRTFGIVNDPVTEAKYIVYNGNHVTWQDFLTGVKTMALCPFLDTPNRGKEYKLLVIPEAYYNPADPDSKFGFDMRYTKSDTYKVRQLATIWGRKVDQDGNPVPGLHIILYAVTKVRGVETLVRIDDTVTNAAGEFSFTGLSAGKDAVDEDLPGTEDPSPGLDPIDYSTWTRVSPPGPIYFTISKGQMGGRSGPGVPIFIGQFVNRNVPAKASIAGIKKLAGTEIPLAGWTITLEMKNGNGSWVTAVDFDGNPVAPQVTGLDGSYLFENLKVDMTYRVREVLKNGWKQVAPNLGSGEVILWPDGSDVSVTPEDAPVTVTACNGGFIVNFGFASDCQIDVSGLNFQNKLADLCAKKVDDLGRPVAGWPFRLYQADGVTPAVNTVTGEPLPVKLTGADGVACWGAVLLGGDYVLKEDSLLGWRAVSPMEVAIHIEPGAECDRDSPAVIFTNHAVICGLTPGYWKNWRNHYTDSQILILLAGTIAPTIAQADAIFAKWDNSPGDEVSHVAAFLLSCQLTSNLTQHPELPHPSGGSLVPECTLPGIEHNLGWWMAEALAIWNAGGAGYTREYMTQVAGVLDAFCNANMP